MGTLDKIFGEDRLKRITNALGGGVGGLLTGGIPGAVGGAVHGYQDKRAATGRRLLQKAGAGAGIGVGTRFLMPYAGKIGELVGSAKDQQAQEEEEQQLLFQKWLMDNRAKRLQSGGY